MIPEAVIEAQIEQLSSDPELYEQQVQALGNEQALVLSYLLSETFDILTASEKAYLLYLALVIWTSVKSHTGTVPDISQEALGSAEEINWATYQNSGGRRFRDRLDVFFEGYPEEDLLAFVEDALEIDDENPEPDLELTKEGREPIFIGLKSIIDCWTKPAASAPEDAEEG
jgi:hypothetical protein